MARTFFWAGCVFLIMVLLGGVFAKTPTQYFLAPIAFFVASIAAKQIGE